MNALELRDNAKHQLAQIANLETGVEYLNKVKAIEIWAKAEKKDAELQNMIAEQKLRTQRILGGLLKTELKHGGQNKKQGTKQGPRLSDFGLSKNESSSFQKIAELPKNIFEKEIALAKEETSKRIELTTARLLKVAKEREKAIAFEKTKAERADIQGKQAIIYKQDCLEFLNRFEDKSVDLLITDPPYSTDVDNIYEFADMWLTSALSKVKDTGRAFVCIGAYPKELHAYIGKLLETDWIVDNPLIWTYRNTLGVTPNMKYNLNYQVILHLYKKTSNPLDKGITNEMFSVQDINAPDGRQGDRWHAWQKPAELGRRLINHTTKKGDIVIDPFACTGTFILEAAKCDRISYGCDIDDNAIEIAKNRGCYVQ